MKSPALLRPFLHLPLRIWNLLAALLLFGSTVAVVLWKNTHHVVLWDLSYALDTSWRIACGEMPYRDFPLAHAPLTFLLQAMLIKLCGRHYLLHALYAASAGGLGTLLTWRMARRRLDTLRSGAATALLLCLPLCFLGIYSILPLPFYDCDCVLIILLILWLAERIPADAQAATHSLWPALLCGLLLPLPLFVKQNIGLPLVALAAVMLVLLYLGARMGWVPLRCHPTHLLAVLAAATLSLLAALVVLSITAGLGNYLHWTVGFAASRRMPGLSSMIEIYQEPLLLYWLPATAVGIALLRWAGRRALWARIAGVLLLALPFLWSLLLVLSADDADDRTSALLALWPFLLILSALHTLWRMARREGGLLALLLLAAIHGTLLSQQLWGSTYAIWPLLVLLIAEMLRGLFARDRFLPRASFAAPLLASLIAISLLISGGIYSLSCERLSYAHSEGAPQRMATSAPLNGLGAPGAYLPEFAELLDFARREIPAEDGILLLPGETPFYFATGRIPRFPVLLFDPATDPLTPAALRDAARQRQIRWLIVSTDEQIKADPMPAREESLALLREDFQPYRQLRGYLIYRRA